MTQSLEKRRIRDARNIGRRRDEAPLVLCACGCGEQMKSVGLNGKPVRFIKNHDKRLLDRSGPKHPGWKGGVRRGDDGYVTVWLSPTEAAQHPTAYLGSGWSIHRSHLVWNTANPDRKVTKGFEIHHINHVRDDDRIENLQLLDGTLHRRLHGLKLI